MPLQVSKSGIKALVEYKLPGLPPEKIELKGSKEVPGILLDFLRRFDVNMVQEKPVRVCQGLFGYISYDAVQFFETIQLKEKPDKGNRIPMMRYRLYQYVIAIDHFKDELYLIENKIAGLASEISIVESLIRNRDVPVFPFHALEAERSQYDG